MGPLNPPVRVARPGFALTFAILLALLLSAAALGMVAVGITEVQLAGATLRHAEARVEAESLARALFRQWSTRTLTDLRPGASRSLLDGGATAAVVERADSTLFLIRTEVRVPPGSQVGAIGRAALLVRVFDPIRTVRAFPAAATVDGPATVTDGLIDGRDRCASGRAGPGVMARSLETGPGAVIEGSPPVLLETPPAPAPPDPLAPPLIAAIANLRPRRTTLAPRPRARHGVCLPDSLNWGALAPGHPCHSLLPVVFAGRDLTLAGGEARAVLVVDGDLRLTANTTLAGIVLVRGTLTLEAGAAVDGAVRAAGLVMRGGAIRAQPCTVDAARSAPALDAGYRPSRRWWLPAF